jgi:hypothetical protein
MRRLFTEARIQIMLALVVALSLAALTPGSASGTFEAAVNYTYRHVVPNVTLDVVH